MSSTKAVSNLVLVVALTGCADLTEPGPSAGEARGAAPAAAPVLAQPAAPGPAAPAEIAASHVLVAYQGATRSTATRNKEEAKRLAEAILTRAKGGADFADLARQHSDDPTAKNSGGSLGKFTRDAMVKPFADAAFALRPGEISGVVESPFGYHVIKRTE